MNLSIAQATIEAAQILREAGVGEARREATSLLAHVLARDHTFLIAHAGDVLSPFEFMRFRECVGRRARGEPLQYITGHQEFFRLDFEVTPAVLIPRPETELIVEAALALLDETIDAPLICDVGTGSGAIIISILHERKRARGVGLDISFDALWVAARNAARHGVSDRLAFVASDCLAALDSSATRFAMIVSNPPYIPEMDVAGLQREVREHEPRIALTPGPDGLRLIRRLLTQAPRFLSPGGHLLFEIGFNQHRSVQQLINKNVWQLQIIDKDLQGIPRTIVLRKGKRVKAMRGKGVKGETGKRGKESLFR